MINLLKDLSSGTQLSTNKALFRQAKGITKDCTDLVALTSDQRVPMQPLPPPSVPPLVKRMDHGALERKGSLDFPLHQ